MTHQEPIDMRVAAFLAAKDETAIISLLQQSEIEPDQVFVVGGVKQRLLALAASQNYTDLAFYLITNGADADRRTFGRTPLLDACDWKNHQLIKALLAVHVNVDARQAAGSGESDDTPLMISAERCDLAAIQLLLAAGADASAKNRHSQTAVHAVLRSYAPQAHKHPDAPEIVQRLIEAGAPLLGTELHFPIYRRDLQMVSLLIARESPVDLPLSKNEEYGPKKGDTPLATLLRFNNFDLAGGSFDYEVTDPARLEICGLLLKHGANPNQPVAKGITPLRLVLPKTHDPFNLGLAKLLVEAGANPHSVPPSSKEPSVADLAVERGLTEFVELFASVADGGNR